MFDKPTKLLIIFSKNALHFQKNYIQYIKKQEKCQKTKEN